MATTQASTKIRQIVTGNFSAKIMLNLGVLSGANNSGEFYTASDILDNIIQTSGITDISKSDFDKLLSNVCTILSQKMRSARIKDIYRSKGKINPRISQARWPHARAGYGYRLGMPVQTPVVNKDTVREANMLIENASVATPEFALIIKGATAKSLANMMLELAIEFSERINAAQDKTTRLQQQLDKIRAAQAAIMEPV